MSTTSVLFDRTMCCSCPRSTAWLYCLVWRSLPVLTLHCFLFFNPVWVQELQKMKVHTYWCPASPLFTSPCPSSSLSATPLHTSSQFYLTFSPSSSPSHIPLFAILSNHTLVHIQEKLFWSNHPPCMLSMDGDLCQYIVHWGSILSSRRWSWRTDQPNLLIASALQPKRDQSSWRCVGASLS